MLSCEDQTFLGFGPEKSRRAASISQVLRKISDHLKSEPEERWDVASEQDALDRYHIHVANNFELRRRAYNLAHRVYRQCGYTAEDSGLIVSEYDAHADTLTLLASDWCGNDCATISLYFDSGAGLPADEVYAQELNPLRARGRKLVEVVRLAMSNESAHSRILLTRLINFIFIYARRVKGFDDFVIEVTPKHSLYYRRLLCFEQIGPQRPCPRVENTVGVLMRLDLSVYEEKIRRAVENQGAGKDRTLFRQFYSWLEEGAVAEFITGNQKPMMEAEKLNFNLSGASKSNLMAAVSAK